MSAEDPYESLREVGRVVAGAAADYHRKVDALFQGMVEGACRSDEPAPAPLDPSKVKAGDTVTVHVDYDPHHMAPFSITGVTYRTPRHGNELSVGGWGLDHPSVTLTAHQPAAEPEPEWKPGTAGTATVRTVPNIRVMRLAGVTQPWVSVVPFTPAGDVKGEGQDRHEDWQVTDFVPDVVIDPTAVDLDALTTKFHNASHYGVDLPLEGAAFLARVARTFFVGGAR